MKLIKTLLLACLFGGFGHLAHAQMQWKDPLQEEFPTVQGRWWQDELKNNYHRFPDRAKGVVPNGPWSQSLHSAGLSVCFRSNSPNIHVRYTTGIGMRQMFHMPSTGSSGLDLYATDRDGEIRWVKGNMSSGDTITFKFENISYRNANKDFGYEYELYLPLFIEVKHLEIGVEEGRMLQFLPVSREQPVVFYGTSIAHGGCASRPGMSWQNILRREMGHPLVNLGFSGNGQLQDPVFDLLGEVPAKLYVIDCMPNMTGISDSIVPRILRGVHNLRRKSGAPILLVEHCGYPGERSSDKRHEAYQRANDQLKIAFDSLTADSIPGIYYMTKEELGLKEDDTVDGTHPNDLGMRHLADGYKKKLWPLLGYTPGTAYKPCTQQRDFYDWRARHEEVLRMGQEGGDFDVVMIGNSITHFWSGEPSETLHRGDDSWKKLFGKRRVLNMGFGWDRIENVLWRLYHGELDGFKAKKIVVMLGTNNISAEPRYFARIPSGIMQVIDCIRKRQPEAEIYVQAIYPRRNELEKVGEVNAKVKERVLIRRIKDKKIHFIDPGSVLLDETGEGIREELYAGDGLHPAEKGYRLIGEKLKGYLGL